MQTIDGWDGLKQFQPETLITNEQDQEDVNRLYLRVFGSDDGQKVLAHLRSLTIEQPTWYPGADASHGYAREGQNSIVREVERRIEKASKQ